MNELEVQLIYDWLGITDGQQQQTINNAIPIAAKLLGHIDDNKQLLATMSADVQLLIPAARIVFDKLALKVKPGT